MATETRPAHRPATYDSSICQKLMDYYDSTEDPTIIDFCQKNDIKRSTFYFWCDDYPELLDIKKKMQAIEAQNFNEKLNRYILTHGDVKVNSTPLVMRARSLGIKTKDDPDNSTADKLVDALKSVVTTYALPDNGRHNPNADKTPS